MKRMKNFKIGIIAALSLNYIHCNILCGDFCFTTFDKVNDVPMNQNDKKIVNDNENKIGYSNVEENEDDNLENEQLSNKDINTYDDVEPNIGSTNKGSNSTKANCKSGFSPDYTSSSTKYNNLFDAKTAYGRDPFLTQKDLFNNTGETKTDDTYSKTEYQGKAPGYENNITPDGCSKNDDINQEADNSKS